MESIQKVTTSEVRNKIEINLLNETDQPQSELKATGSIKTILSLEYKIQIASSSLDDYDEHKSSNWQSCIDSRLPAFSLKHKLLNNCTTP